MIFFVGERFPFNFRYRQLTWKLQRMGGRVVKTYAKVKKFVVYSYSLALIVSILLYLLIFKYLVLVYGNTCRS